MEGSPNLLQLTLFMHVMRTFTVLRAMPVTTIVERNVLQLTSTARPLWF